MAYHDRGKPDSRSPEGHRYHPRRDSSITTQRGEDTRTTLFLFGIPRNVRAADLAHDFGRYGPLVRVEIPAARSHWATSYGFVQFERHENAANALYWMRGTYLANSNIELRIEWAKDQSKAGSDAADRATHGYVSSSRRSGELPAEQYRSHDQPRLTRSRSRARTRSRSPSPRRRRSPSSPYYQHDQPSSRSPSSRPDRGDGYTQRELRRNPSPFLTQEERREQRKRTVHERERERERKESKEKNTNGSDQRRNNDRRVNEQHNANDGCSKPRSEPRNERSYNDGNKRDGAVFSADDIEGQDLKQETSALEPGEKRQRSRPRLRDLFAAAAAEEQSKSTGGTRVLNGEQSTRANALEESQVKAKQQNTAKLDVGKARGSDERCRL